MISEANTKKDELEPVDLQYKDIDKDINWCRYILLNKPLRLSIVFLIVAVLAPLLLYQFLYFAGVDLFTSDGFSLGSCLVPRESRFPCGYGNITPEECHPQCCYDFSNGMCFHRFPSRFSFLMDRIWTENITLKPRVATVPYKNQPSVTSLRVAIDEVSSTHMSITYYDSTNISLIGNRIEEKDYSYEIDSPELNLVVNSSGRNIFDTVRGPLIASENIWEIAFVLTNETMYGFGEIPIKINSVKIIYNHKGGMTSIPLIFAKINGTFHGLLIDIAEPTEVVFMSNNAIVVRSINNFGLKFHLFTGPKPEDIMRDVVKLLNIENNLDYWMLGVHVCSEMTSLADINTFIQESNSNNLPYESHCVTPIVFDNNCENNQEIDDGAKLFKNAGKRFVPHISPYIIYEENEENLENNETISSEATECYRDFSNFTDYFLKEPNTIELFKGLINKTAVIYPNYEVVNEEFMRNLWIYETDFDGIVLENTWPLDESDTYVNETHNYLPYFGVNFEEASSLTLQWNVTNKDGEKHLYQHNKYGNHFAEAINKIKTVPTWTSSQWLSGKNNINRQNIRTSWTSLHKEMIEAALGGISGQWLWSTPICGDTHNFNTETHSELCLKWYMAASFLPMIRIHSANNSRLPLSFPTFEKDLMIRALRNRIALTPYFWTCFHKGPLLRPMFYQFPGIEELHDLNTQFAVGDYLMIVPNLQPDQSMVHFMLPPGVWYEFWGGLKLESDVVKTVTMMTTESDFLVLMKAGAIIVLQKDVKLTAELTRTQSDISIKIALNCYENNEQNSTQCFANGELYLDINRTVFFEANIDNLKISTNENYSLFCENIDWTTKINEIDIYGLNNSMNNFDNYKNILINIDLCELQNTGEIVVRLS